MRDQREGWRDRERATEREGEEGKECRENEREGVRTREIERKEAGSKERERGMPQGQPSPKRFLLPYAFCCAEITTD